MASPLLLVVVMASVRPCRGEICNALRDAEKVDGIATGVAIPNAITTAGTAWLPNTIQRGAFCDGGPSLVDDFMWVSVLRMAPGGQGVGHCDGHCHGFTAREASSSTYDAIIPNSSRWSKVNYGCWFYMAISASAHSGAYVNVGRSLRLRTRCEAHEVLYKSRKSSNALCTDRPGDKLWCTQARAQGYDSIQIQRGTAYPKTKRRRPWGELIYCGDECSHSR